MPIVVLETSRYRHPKYGPVDTPRLNVVGWTDAEPPKTEASPRPLDDDIPF
jgi:hypothetical protein